MDNKEKKVTRGLEKSTRREREKEQKQNNHNGEKAKLEDKWEMLRWISKFIDEHKDRWEKERIERKKAGKRETTTS